jgi:D-alanyl-D-alanine carboxypeptidase (penicillin-binding protein 5/6)
MITVVAVLLIGHSLISSAPATAAHDQRLTQSPIAWPEAGAAAVAVGGGTILTSGPTTPVPIASLAKVMTAEVVLRSHPLPDGGDGFLLTITPVDVSDAEIRRAQGQSVVAVAVGEQLSERQALNALLLPSANNIAITLANAVSGSTDAFVDQMNREASRLGMADTTYTDPSGFAPSTVSNAHDQVVLARAAMQISAFRDIVAQRHATVPVEGLVTNTDTLVGQDGFLGIKTGSDQAAGGCFLFARRFGRGKGAPTLYGVVLGQRQGSLIAASLEAARRLGASVATMAGRRKATG